VIGTAKVEMGKRDTEIKRVCKHHSNLTYLFLLCSLWSGAVRTVAQ
jgi:hypothetical protein